MSIIDTKINIKVQDSFPAQEPVITENEDIDIELVRSKIRSELMLNIESERLAIIEIGKEEAANIKLEAEKVGHELGMKAGFDQGYKEGHEQGYQQGMDRAQVEGECIKNNALHLLDQAEQNIKQYVKDNTENIIGLAAEMAESIVHLTIDISSENILMLIKPVLQQYEKKGNVIITCHSNGMPYLTENLHHIEKSYPDSKFILLIDNNLEENGCIIENENQILDLQIKKQINSIIEDLKDIKNLE